MTSDSCTPTLEDTKGDLIPKIADSWKEATAPDMSTGIGVVRVDVGQEASQGARPKRGATTRRRRVPRDDRLQSTAEVSMNTTVNAPKSLSKSPSAVGAVARQIDSSSTEREQQEKATCSILLS